MATFDDIRRGLAANLNVLDDFQISPWLLDNPSPDAIQIAGAEDVAYDVAFPKAGKTSEIWNIQIEACLLRNSDIGPQKRLDVLLAPYGDGSLKAAVEADPTLTKRLQDDGTYLTGQDPACADLQVIRFRGQQHHTLDNGTDVLLAVWTVQVLT